MNLPRSMAQGPPSLGLVTRARPGTPRNNPAGAPILDGRTDRAREGGAASVALGPSGVTLVSVPPDPFPSLAHLAKRVALHNADTRIAHALSVSPCRMNVTRGFLEAGDGAARFDSLSGRAKRASLTAGACARGGPCAGSFAHTLAEGLARYQPTVRASGRWRRESEREAHSYAAGRSTLREVPRTTA
jgi:hypothetical protein